MTKPHDGDTTTPLAARLRRVISPAERRVAEYLEQAGPRAAPMSAQEIATAVGTSDATVVRTAKSLGYASLRQLRGDLARMPEDADLAARLRATIGTGPTAHDILATSVERQLRGLDTLVRRVPPEDFDAAAAVLTGAAHVWWSGTGPSAHLAGYAAFLCRRLGRPSGSLTHAGTDHADELLDLRPGHAVVVLAYGHTHPYVRVLVQRAAEVGAQVVLITDTVAQFPSLPIAARLNAGRGAPGLFATHGPTVILLEALVLAIAAADPARSEQSLASLNDLRQSLAGRRLDVDPA